MNIVLKRTTRLIPFLHDEVWRLYKVGKKGSLVRSLNEAKIKTVGDFIICLFLRPQYLEEIFAGAKHAKSFKVTVKHALKCPSKLKYCSSFDQKNGVVFEVSGQGVSKQLVTTAFENWGNVTIVNEDQLVAHCSPNVLNHHSSLSNASYRYENTDKSIIRDGYDLHINENSLFCNEIIDGKHQNPQILPELRRPFIDIYCGFENLCTSGQHQPVKFCKRWRVMFCVITLTMGSLCDIRAHKKQRLS
ncbi:hypothetical protein CTI12_AA089100 [Artemisia annua]|uniref:Calmodulin binding protein central domain-containing protein n=1 Tax=Artemisia annua TaxID=35608 RepID=A0A2U1Q0Q0_ARTAN|nr:hypothetical protein CTI12_AA089100 [Artemisia annua]